METTLEGKGKGGGKEREGKEVQIANHARQPGQPPQPWAGRDGAADDEDDSDCLLPSSPPSSCV